MDQSAMVWAKIQAGEVDAFNALYHDQVDGLYAYGLSICKDAAMVQDAIQEVFITIWNKKNSLGQIENIHWYLHRALRNRLLRAMEQNRFVELSDAHPSGEAELSIESILIDEGEAAERIIKLRKAMAELSDRQREALHLRYFENRDYTEIASLLDMEQQSAYNLIFRAIQGLRKMLQGSR
jgi:RNA polymerase sigma factor (sigma-70 family)